MPNVIDKVVVNGNTYDLPGGDYSNFAPIESDASSSSANYVIGDHLVVNNIYCEVIDTISIGDAIVDTGANANVKPANVGEEITKINNELTANNQQFRYGYDSTTDRYGYIIESGGADTFRPFRSNENEIVLLGSYTNASRNNRQILDLTSLLPNYNTLTIDNFIVVPTSHSLYIESYTAIGGKREDAPTVISTTYDNTTGKLTITELTKIIAETNHLYASTIRAFKVFYIAEEVSTT